MPMNELLQQMISLKQITQGDADALVDQYNGTTPSLTEGQVLEWLGNEYGVPFSELEEIEPEPKLLSLFPARILLKQGLLPVCQTGDRVEVATSRLFATEGIDLLKSMTGLKLVPLLAPSEAITRKMKKHLGVGADTLDTLEEEAGIQVVNESNDENVDLDEAAKDASIIKFVNQVLGDAIALRATDVHIEPFEEELRIRYRIDGVLQEVPTPTSVKRFQAAIVSRVKILSHLDIAEKRLPQDGRIKVRVENHEVDIRVSLIPMLHGEAVVLRLLQQDTELRGLKHLGLGPRDHAILEGLLNIPHGIILVTGPTGSGKSTTLYAALNEINDIERKIITVEDPVEYHMQGINQIQVSEKTGLTFARGLRAILRHDPDVVLIGEIRDGETAQIAVQASLTGHLVFSTLHTNDAPGALTRLVDMGVEPYLVASSLEGVLAQRLVRVLCPICKIEDTSVQTQAIREEIGVLAHEKLYRSAGCENCRNTGYNGRRAIFELMEMTDEIRDMALHARSSGEIRKMARQQGMSLLNEDGWRVVREGVTTIEEVMRVSRDQRKRIGITNGQA